jgi:hypothetical protein
MEQNDIIVEDETEIKRKRGEREIGFVFCTAT